MWKLQISNICWEHLCCCSCTHVLGNCFIFIWTYSVANMMCIWFNSILLLFGHIELQIVWSASDSARIILFNYHINGCLQTLLVSGEWFNWLYRKLNVSNVWNKVFLYYCYFLKVKNLGINSRIYDILQSAEISINTCELFLPRSCFSLILLGGLIVNWQI